MTYDDDGFGYVAPSTVTLVADWLDRSEAKAVYRHYDGRKARRALLREGRLYELENVSYVVEAMYDGEWRDITSSWGYQELEGIEDWCDRKGIDYGEYMYGGVA